VRVSFVVTVFVLALTFEAGRPKAAPDPRMLIGLSAKRLMPDVLADSPPRFDVGDA
jgi:hypothetical protein